MNISEQLKTARWAILAFVVVPGLLAHALAYLMHVWIGPLIDAEFLMVGILWLWLPGWARVAALGWVSGALLVFGVVHTFSLGAADVGVLVSGALTLPALTVVKWVVAWIGFTIACVLVARPTLKREPRERGVVALVLAGLLVTGFALDYANGFGPFRNGAVVNQSEDVWRGDWQFISVPEPGLWRLRRILRIQAAHHGTGHRMEAASDRLESLAGQPSPPNIVLIVVESWGQALDSAIEQSFWRSYTDQHLMERYELRQGVAPFTGSTVYGESRELCQLDLGFGIISIPGDSLKSCLPWRLRAHGYQTLAVHGNEETLFSRFQWYPRVGFQRAVFQPTLAKAGLPNCDGFIPGTCDESVAQWIGDQLAMSRQSAPRFIYWLTLNSHLPLRPRTDSLGIALCAPYLETRSDPGVCAWFSLIGRVHRAVAALASRSDISRTAFVIVGDHAPPFSFPKRRHEFAQNVVPFFALIPRS